MITIDKSILNRIRGSGAGSVFAPNQFLDLGNRSAVGVALHRLVKAGKITEAVAFDRCRNEEDLRNHLNS